MAKLNSLVGTQSPDEIEDIVTSGRAINSRQRRQRDDRGVLCRADVLDNGNHSARSWLCGGRRLRDHDPLATLIDPIVALLTREKDDHVADSPPEKRPVP
ncbi:MULTISPECIES: hypothetical protein [unclassified Microbacterium]|uniref:hypothetical protein n=1 Tax=unclassified Microbacterium TaxID=2609290 RepID=UPI001780E452|nr:MULTISPECIES: hypothetical protein [unclassified Microbacterium]MBD8207362.1 hypothetical protein [Microbacterium sp. CFBP 8801]MBD8479725.1 hypothetical protein [Microbacterium sp. CFBP 8794]MBD8511009.1 hypothetical protein [Microbacterium sp. CFBP 8790]